MCGELPGARPAKKGFNTIAYQMGKGQGMQFTSEDTQLQDKWGKRFISGDPKERRIETTLLCLPKQQKWQTPCFHGAARPLHKWTLEM